MIFETKEKDLILKVERVLEVEKSIIDGIGAENKKIQIPVLKVLTVDTQREIKYKTKEDRDFDYEQLKKSLNGLDILTKKTKRIGKYFMKKENKEKLLNLYDELEKQEKSIEYILYYISDVLNIKYEYVVKIITRNRFKELKQEV